MSEKAFSFLLLVAVALVGLAALADLNAGRAWPGFRAGLVVLVAGVVAALVSSWRRRAEAWETRPEEDGDGAT